jgi:uncharacterized protein (TIGR00251 family)
MSDALDLYSIEDGAVVLSVHVQPRAGRSAVVGRHGHALKVQVAAPPLDDRANEATALVLADELGVAKGAVELIGGARSREKRFRITTDDVDGVVKRIERTLEGTSQGAGPSGRRGRR